MADETLISWADKTHNHWLGCSKVSPACDGCYAAHLMETRMGRVTWGGPGKGEGTRALTSEANRRKPLAWNKKAAAAPGHTFVFCASLADVFDNAVPPEWRRDLFDLIRATPNLTWLLLTKRPGMIVKLWAETFADESGAPVALTADFWPRNAAIGCTVVTQEEADRDVPKLLAAKAALKPAFAFLSMEPLLGPVDMTRWLPARRVARRAGTGEPFLAPHYFMTRCEHCGWVGSSELCGTDVDDDVYCPACRRSFCADEHPALDWVITGGETDQGGHKARPADPAWYRSLRDQCAAAGVPFHFKQWGEWVAHDEISRPVPQGPFTWDRDKDVWRVGKAHDPCTLDGVKHDARPEVARG